MTTDPTPIVMTDPEPGTQVAIYTEAWFGGIAGMPSTLEQMNYSVDDSVPLTPCSMVVPDLFRCRFRGGKDGSGEQSNWFGPGKYPDVRYFEKTPVQGEYVLESEAVAYDELGCVELFQRTDGPDHMTPAVADGSGKQVSYYATPEPEVWPIVLETGQEPATELAKWTSTPRFLQDVNDGWLGVQPNQAGGSDPQLLALLTAASTGGFTYLIARAYPTPKNPYPDPSKDYLVVRGDCSWQEGVWYKLKGVLEQHGKFWGAVPWSMELSTDSRSPWNRIWRLGPGGHSAPDDFVGKSLSALNVPKNFSAYVYESNDLTGNAVQLTDVGYHDLSTYGLDNQVRSLSLGADKFELVSVVYDWANSEKSVSSTAIAHTVVHSTRPPDPGDTEDSDDVSATIEGSVGLEEAWDWQAEAGVSVMVGATVEANALVASTELTTEVTASASAAYGKSGSETTTQGFSQEVTAKVKPGGSVDVTMVVDIETVKVQATRTWKSEKSGEVITDSSWVTSQSASDADVTIAPSSS